VTEARLVRVTGVVQGVGFRPFVHRLAARHGLAGAVRNASGEVEIEIEGPSEELDAFLRELRAQAPPLARIDQVEQQPSAVGRRRSFEIADSRAPRADRRLPIAPDAAMCAACEAELLDPGNRRYRYPFITCSDCGPRYTVIEALPYDRERTSLRAFTQCPACRREYEDPADRRYHSETNSCPACGPGLWVEASGGEAPAGHPPGIPKDPGRSPGIGPPTEAIRVAADGLLAGRIVAARGLGGFHLAVDATNAAAVLRLRARKHREAKPLAVMVATLEQARALVDLSPAEAQLLCSTARPIVVARRRASGPLADAVSPGLDTVGVMLAYTPLHRLLLDAVGRPLVMTSGNRTEEPIATSLDDARSRLGGIADALLLHDRDIVARYDDSVARVVDGAPLLLRRARGYAPLPVPLPVPSPHPLIAVGPHLKNTFTLALERDAFVSQHIGDLENLETLEHFSAVQEAYRRLFRIKPAVVAHDLHPGYLSSRAAEEFGLPLIGVQHHHAHIAALLGEHGVHDDVIGLAFDGTGYGEDGRIWGAEFLIAGPRSFRRVGHLRYAPLPGGDAAARRPWRAAAGYLALDETQAPVFSRAFEGVPARWRAMVERQVAAAVNAPLASSMGRLFDAAAAVLGVRRESAYEGQAAMELEALARDLPADPLPFPAMQHATRMWELDPLPLLGELGVRAAAGHAVAGLAAAFHESVAAAAADLAARIADGAGIDTVALGGGCFQNARLLASLARRLAARGFRVLTPRRLPPNDGAVSYGQAVVAAARLAAGEVVCA
jgi:hydrogenase maturation protein HypF